MTTYVAFLRGVNVGTHNRMTMDDLRSCCESLGLGNVRTYIQSGNVAFEHGGTDAEALAETIADGLLDAFDYDVAVVVRTHAELEAVVAAQPFDDAPDGESRRYVTFLAERPGDEEVAALEAKENEAETFEVRGREVYSELRPDLLERGRFTDAGKVLGVAATRRNWDVVTAVLDLASS